jgi:PIN domain nuclease of toxin-antitoxin system
MIVLDTHIWIWWASDSEDLSDEHRDAIEAHEEKGLAVSAISCWEVAKLVEYDRLELTAELEPWMRAALGLPGMQQIELTPQIAIESTQLPGSFHSDPADQIITATARLHDAALATEDQKIRSYDHVEVI